MQVDETGQTKDSPKDVTTVKFEGSDKPATAELVIKFQDRVDHHTSQTL